MDILVSLLPCIHSLIFPFSSPVIIVIPTEVVRGTSKSSLQIAMDGMGMRDIHLTINISCDVRLFLPILLPACDFLDPMIPFPFSNPWISLRNIFEACFPIFPSLLTSDFLLFFWSGQVDLFAF